MGGLQFVITFRFKNRFHNNTIGTPTCQILAAANTIYDDAKLCVYITKGVLRPLEPPPLPTSMLIGLFCLQRNTIFDYLEEEW